MGSSGYSSMNYSKAVDHLQSTGQTFARSATAQQTRNFSASAIADILNPRKLKNGVRESCFAPGFNDATPIIVSIDATGSMSQVPADLRDQLPKLIELLIEQGVSDHPNVMFMVHDDEQAQGPDAVFQMSQFEIGPQELTTALNECIFPGNGGGNRGEAYHLPIYAAANHTRLECFERDGQKGFLFLIGDEEPYYGAGDPTVKGTSPEIAKECFGDTIEGEVSMLESLKKASERFHIFLLRPGHTSHGTNPVIKARWQELFEKAGIGTEHVIDVAETPALITTMAMTIGTLAGIDRDALVDVLKQKGAAGVDKAASSALSLRPAQALVGTASGALAEAEAPGRKRL